MPQYDPQRSRSRHRSGDDGPAPVDALLGPAPGQPGAPGAPLSDDRPSDDAAGDRGSVSSDIDSSALDDWVDPLPSGRSGPPPLAPAVVVGLLVAAVAIVWALLRRRRRDAPPEG